MLTVVAAFAVAATIGGAAFSAAGHHDPGLQNEEQYRKQHDKEFEKDHTDKSGKLRPDLWRKGIAAYQAMPVSATWHDGSGAAVSAGALAAPETASATSAVVGAQWTQVGPKPLRINAEQNFQGQGPDSGAVQEIAIDPRNSTDKVIYLAANDGGIWKTTNGGTTWTPKTDFMPSNSMGAVALDAGNPSIVYAGTGNFFNNGFLKGVGIYKSVDSGETWTALNPGGVFTSGNVGKPIVRMASPAAGVLVVGVDCRNQACAGGVYRSADGGLNFGNNSPNFNNGQRVLNGNVSDVKLDTTTNNGVLAAIDSTGIFRSTDGGATWGTNLFTATNGAPTANFNYITFGQSTAPDNQTIYASVAGGNACPATGTQPSGCNYNNLYVSADLGANWTAQGTLAGSAFAAGTGCQCGYDQTVGVDPADANKVYLGFQRLWYSSNGGAGPFNAVSDNNIHWDEHALVFSPSTHTASAPGPETRIYVGNDGGIARSDNAGAAWDNTMNETIATNLFRGIDIGRGSATNNNYSYGGTQDTGTIGHRDGDTGTDWHLGIDGDGGPVSVDPCDPQHVLGTDNGGFQQTTNGGNTWIGGGGMPAGTGLNVSTFDPSCAERTPATRLAYFAGTTNQGGGPPPTIASRLFFSTNNGSTFSTMQTFATSTNPARITTIATTPQDSNILWVGFNDGTVQRTSNALAGASATWTSVVVTGSPGSRVGDIALDPTNPQVAVVVYQGFTGLTSNVSQHVFRTTDNGATWSNVSGTSGAPVTTNLPDLPTHSVVIDSGTAPHSIIVSNDAGVLRSLNNGATWQRFGVGLPTVDSTRLALDADANPPVLRIGTYGRSTFELTSAASQLLSVNADLAFGTVSVNTSATRVVQLFNTGSTDLHISGFDRVSGSTDFSVSSGPPTPVTIAPGDELDYTVRFRPTSSGNKTATFQVNSDDPYTPQFQIPASGTGATGHIAVSGSLDFGTVARGTSATRDLTVQNTGEGVLNVSNVALLLSSDPAYSILGNPGSPQVVQPGDSIIYTVKFAPPATLGPGTKTATVRISSDDPANPVVNLDATGIVGVPNTVLDSGDLAFGGVPVDSRTSPNSADRVLRISNQASCSICDVTVNGLPITGANFGDFNVVNPPGLPVTIAAGNHLDLTVRFNPSAAGPRNATLEVNSSDPVAPSQTVTLSGQGLLPAITAAPGDLIFPPTVFDPVCPLFCGTTLNETYANTGQAELSVDTILFTGSAAFSGPVAGNPPARFAPSNSFTEPITFRPTVGSARKLTATVLVQDEFPSDPPTKVGKTVSLCGESVGRGIRVLAVDGAGNIATVLSSLKLTSLGTAPNVNINLKNLGLITIDPPTSCQRIQYQYENQNLPATDQTAPKGSYYTLSVTVGNKKGMQTFTLKPNEFKQIAVTVN